MRGTLSVGSTERCFGQKPQRLPQRHKPPRLCQPERPYRRALELLAVRVAEVGHELAHVGPGGDLELEPHAVALTPELLEAVDRDRARLALDVLASARLLVEPLASHLLRAVRRRTLEHLAGRQ